MHRLEEAILQAFKKDPEREFSTNELVQSFFADEAKPLHKGDEAAFKRKKAKHHRQLLYHLNKLVDDGVLKVSRVQQKGEKCFVLALDEGELIVGKRYKKIIISKTGPTKSPLEGYIADRVVSRYGHDRWANQVNSVLIRGDQFEHLPVLQDQVSSILANVNDVVGVDHFEHFLKETSHDPQAFLNKLDLDSRNNDNRVNLLLHLDRLHEQRSAKAFIQAYAHLKPKKIDLIFVTDTKALQVQGKLFHDVFALFAQDTIKVYVQNKALAKAPFLVGDTGIYTFHAEEWEQFLQAYPHAKGTVCSQAAIVIDMKRFFQQQATASSFRHLLLTAMRALVMVNTQQRRRTNEYFRHVLELDPDSPLSLFALSRNYIRLWNYDLEEEKEKTLGLLESCKELARDFCVSQETIFKSCGVPARCRVAFSSAFHKFDPHLTDRIYRKQTITKHEDLFSKDVKEHLHVREELFSLFEGADRVRIFRGGSIQPHDMQRELVTVLSTYTFPLFCYDFATLQGTVKLTQFLD